MSAAPRPFPIIVAVVALIAIGLALWRLEAAKSGLAIESRSVGATPVTVYRPIGGRTAPAVVIAHGFAGSRQMMAPFAVTLARNGYVAVTFDFLGHGRNPLPLTGDLTDENGATERLLAQLQDVIAFAQSLGQADGRLALIGHSMASDIVVRAAVADPTIEGTVAVSMFSRAVTDDAPANLLVITGEWEGFLRGEALRAVGLGRDRPAAEGVTYGSAGRGTARRAAVAQNVEHIGVLYSRTSMAEALAWLDAAFHRDGGGFLDVRGPWLGLLFAGLLALAWPLSRLLPRFACGSAATAISRRRLLVIGVVPAVATPLILWPLPTDTLPVLVAGYLALHFAVYGAMTWLLLRRAGDLAARPPTPRLALVTLAATLVAILGIALPLDAYVTSFMPTAGRAPVIFAIAAGTVVYALADEWLVRRPLAPWWAYGFTKLCLLGSLALAVAIDLDELFFLIIILPVILIFFLLYGVLSLWLNRATGCPTVAGVAVGAAFGWALGVTFPVIAA